MKKTLLFLIVLLLLLPFPASAAALESARDALLVSGDGDYLDDWSIFALARSGGGEDFAKIAEEYAASLAFRLYRNGGALSPASETEYARVALSVTALGYRADAFAGFDLLSPLSDTDHLASRSLNGLIFSLLALDAGAYELAQGKREAIVSEILARRGEAGGWSIYGSAAAADPDMTAMALTALSPYRSLPAVASAIEGGLAVIRDLQLANGGFISLGIETSESAAQVIVALATLGEKPETFASGEQSVLDALLSYETVGGFAHTASGEANRLATLQACLALEACRRASAGEAGIYEMSDAASDFSVSFTVEDAASALALPLTQTVRVEDALRDLLGRLLLSPDRASFFEAEAHLADVARALDAAEARLARLAAACRALPRDVTAEDRETVRALRREVDALPSADRAMLAEQEYLDAAESALAVIDRTRILTVSLGALAAVGTAALVLRIVLRRRRAIAEEREGEE